MDEGKAERASTHHLSEVERRIRAKFMRTRKMWRRVRNCYCVSKRRKERTRLTFMGVCRQLKRH